MKPAPRSSSTKNKCIRCVVAIGGSAGALEALQCFVGALPAATGASFIVVQHMDPRQKSFLPELLAHSSPFPVSVAKNGLRLEPDHLYVVEPGVGLELRDEVFQTRPLEDIPDRKRPIDYFFHSLAKSFGHCAIGVVISGTGRDGTDGLGAIQSAGGLTYVQDPAEARFDGMPRSAIGEGVAEHVLPVQEIVRSLSIRFGQMVERPSDFPIHLSGTEESEDLERVCRALLRLTGHDFSSYKKSTVARRVERRIQARHASSLSEYLNLLESDPVEAQALLKDLLISVTQFFRDPEAFDALDEEVIPRLFHRATQNEGIRIWVPACATGEEAYSLAILLKEYQRTKGYTVPLQIFATDIDRSALDIARQGKYSETIIGHIPEAYLARYFERQSGTLRVKEELREICIFSEHSLIKNAPFSNLDLISCRNLFIYWEAELQNKVLPVFHFALKPDGYLFLGPAESVTDLSEFFRTIDKKHRIFQRMPGRGGAHHVFPLLSFKAPLKAGFPGGTRHFSHYEERELSRAISTSLLENYAPPAVVINEHGEIIFFSGKTGKYLQPPIGAPSNNIFDLIRREIRPELHPLVHKAVFSGTEVIRSGLVLENDGFVQKLNLVIRPLSEHRETSGLYMIIFQEVTALKSKEEAASEGISVYEPSPLVQQLETELRETREHLQNTVEEVKSSNEELLSMNEELQSANEELQTSKEELQSTNEELETVNAELSKKLEDLDQANSDLQNFFQNTQVPTIFLDRQYRIQKFTPATARVFRLIPTDTGRSILDISSDLADLDLVSDFKEVLESLQTREREISTKDGQREYLMRVSPYRTINDVINGVVLTFTDVTELKKAQQAERHLAAIVENSDDAIISKNLNAVITSWNKGAERLFGYTAEEMIGTPIYRIVPPDHPEDVRGILSTISRGEKVHHFETVRVTKQGRRVNVSLSVSPIRDSTGRIIGAAKIARDITDKKMAEEAMRRSIVLRDEFISLASHELKSPLTSMKLQNEIIKRKIVKGDETIYAPEEVKKRLHKLNRQLDRLNHLVDDMLDISRITAGKLSLCPEPVELSEIISDVQEHIGEYIEQSGCKLRTELEAGVQGTWDRPRLEQVVTNLLTNAMRYAKGKPITIRTRSEGDSAVLEVKDEGMGIAKEDQQRIFERFERASSISQGGFGIGLYIVREIVKAHGGTVMVESDLGKGSLFKVILPKRGPTLP